jgi:hypothetical protein
MNKLDDSMDTDNSNFMLWFLDRREGLPFYKSACEYHPDPMPYLEIKSVPVLLAFFGFLKYQLKENKLSRGCDVYVRGHTQPYPHLVPSLFRQGKVYITCYDEINRRIKAFDDFIAKIQHAEHYFSGFRKMKPEDVGAILQHYGFNTPWIDVVNNIYPAVWFAQNEQINCDKGAYYSKAKNFGWLTFIATKDKNGIELIVKDLQPSISSLNLRPIAQHGHSFIHPDYTKQELIQKCLNVDTHIVAQVKFPLTGFKLDSQFLSTVNLFPSESYDTTSEELKNTEDITTNYCEEIEKLHCLEPKALGRYVRIINPSKRLFDFWPKQTSFYFNK